MQLICTKTNHVSSLLAHYTYRFGVLETYQRRYFQSLRLGLSVEFQSWFWSRSCGFAQSLGLGRENLSQRALLVNNKKMHTFNTPRTK